MREARIPFTAFLPFPWAVFMTLRRGELTLTEWRVLLDLWSRWRPGRDLTVRVHDLDSLAKSVCWEGKTGTLSKALRSLRDKGWIDFDSRPGRTRHPYDFSLLLPAPSEHDPSSDASSQGETDGVGETTDPSTARLDPSSGNPGIRRCNGNCDGAGTDPIRAAEDLRRTTTSLSEENVGPARAREETEDELLDRLFRESAPPHPGAYSEPDT